MSITNKPFHQLSSQELYQIIQLRFASFVIEQNVIYQDLDNIDLNARHLMFIKNKEINGYLRFHDLDDKKKTAKFSRICVSKENRGEHLGATLIKSGIIFANKNQYKSIKITAQQYLINYYKSFKFFECSEAYTINNIPHIDMQLELL